MWEHNNLAQKNLTIVDLKPNQWIVLPFVVKNLKSLVSSRVLLEIVRPADRQQMQASLIQKSGAAFNRRSGLTVEPFAIPLPSSPADQGEALDCGGHAGAGDKNNYGLLTSDTTRVLAAGQFADALEVHFATGATAQIPISMRAGQQLSLGLRFTVPQTAASGEVIKLNIVQRDSASKRISGGLAVEVHVR